MECAIAAGVTGIYSGGVGGIVVGAACTANALWQASLASSECGDTHCQNL